jgi:hypothetical protein
LTAPATIPASWLTTARRTVEQVSNLLFASPDEWTAMARSSFQSCLQRLILYNRPHVRGTVAATEMLAERLFSR